MAQEDDVKIRQTAQHDNATMSHIDPHYRTLLCEHNTATWNAQVTA